MRSVGIFSVRDTRPEERCGSFAMPRSIGVDFKIQLAIALRRSRLINPIGMKTSSSISISRFRNTYRVSPRRLSCSLKIALLNAEVLAGLRPVPKSFNNLTTRNHT